ncbi:MAG: hypothetical protein R3C09_18205 [Pirellulaceae bacterium]
MSKYTSIACLAVALALVGMGAQEAKAQHGHHGHHGHFGHHGHHGGFRGYGAHFGGYGRLPVYGYGSYYAPGLSFSRSSYYSGGSFPSTLGPFGGLGGYGNYGYLSHQPAAPRVRLRIGF